MARTPFRPTPNNGLNPPQGRSVDPWMGDVTPDPYRGMTGKPAFDPEQSNRPMGSGPTFPPGFDVHGMYKQEIGSLEPKVKDFLDFVANAEGTSEDNARKRGFATGYNVPLGFGAYGVPPKPLTGMSIGDVKQFQNEILSHPDNNLDSSAVGRYQLVRGSLADAQAKLGLTDSDLFDQQAQDALGFGRLKYRNLDKYTQGLIDEDQFLDELHNEWFSIPSSRDQPNNSQRRGATLPQARDAIRKLKEGR